MENNKLEERLNRIEHKMAVMFDQLIDIKTQLKKQAIGKRLDDVKNQKQKCEDEQKYLEMDLDSIWQENERIQKEFRYDCYGDCEEVDMRN